MAGLLILSLMIIFIFISFFILMRQVDTLHYDVVGNSEVSKKAKEKYLNEFKNYTESEVMGEIELIANDIVDNKKSNRYTELLRQKASKDRSVKDLKNAFVDDVDIVKYNDGNMKAKVKYKSLDTLYSMVLNLTTVGQGNLFLDDYTVYKESLNEG